MEHDALPAVFQGARRHAPLVMKNLSGLFESSRRIAMRGAAWGGAAVGEVRRSQRDGATPHRGGSAHRPLAKTRLFPMLAYLVIREGAKWTDVFRLVPGQAVTIGRAPTNQIVIKDERCSRAHAEVFYAQGQWVVRDLDSRNGTTIGGNPVRGDHILDAGEIIRIGHSQIAFVHDLTKAFPDSSAVRARSQGPHGVERGDDAGRVARRGECALGLRADDDHASPRPDEVSRAGRRART